ncbi:hypothetical protein [Cryptosporangium phraense]|uniref:LysR substrate-binding domain-containing protein n=1 Tax=Cryptosporangium phraense TaxID=2593070 RepID=A0A545ATS7_9ACTN|nr:hypothetical protein [Cryptosporangium phraense]TQS44005.1 hypothetical protein FL583_16245 [Cryptosporangium phraense]
MLARLVADNQGLALVPTGRVPAVPGVTALPLHTPDVVHRTELLVPRARADSFAPLVRALAGGTLLR